MELTTIATLIRLARAARNEASSPKRNLATSEARHRASMPALGALERFIDALPDEEKHEAVALCWFGRGDDDNYEVALRAARREEPETAAGYLSGKTPLDTYLLRGVMRLLGVPDWDEAN